MTPVDPIDYVNMAAASDLFEIRSSQLALSKAQSPEVREFAQMLVTHHSGRGSCPHSSATPRAQQLD